MLGTKTNAYKNIINYSNAFDSLNVPLDIINLGSTNAYYAFDYTNMEIRGANWALPPQTLYYDFQILKQYNSSLKKGTIVCISMFYFSFMVINYGKDRYYYKYYHILNSDKIIGYSKLKEILWNHAPALVMPGLFKRMLKDISPDNNTVDLIKTNQEDSILALQWMEGWNKQFGWEKDFKIFNQQKATMNEVTNILSKMLNYCFEKGFRPVLVIPPISLNLQRLLPGKLIQECFWDNMDHVISDRTIILDYTNNGELNKNNNFYNALCLNKRGKSLFNKQFIRDISEYF